MTLTDAQHCTWFMASLTPHLMTTLSQQKISTQAEALETTMRLHETPLQDLGLEFNKSVNPKFVFGNVEVKTGTDIAFGSPGGSMVYKVQELGTR